MIGEIGDMYRERRAYQATGASSMKMYVVTSFPVSTDALTMPLNIFILDTSAPAFVLTSQAAFEFHLGLTTQAPFITFADDSAFGHNIVTIDLLAGIIC